MFAITVSKIHCIEDTAGPGNDEPYVLVFAIDFHKDPDVLSLTPQSGVNLYGPFEDMNDEDMWGDTEVNVNEESFWGFDGNPRDITDPADAVILVALCESDHNQSFSNTVRAQVQSAMQGQLASYVSTGMDRDAILARLPRDMQGHVDLAIRTDIEKDERLGPVIALTVTQADLNAANGGSTTRTLKFESGAEESEYDVTFRIDGNLGTSSDALSVASKKVRYAALWEESGGPAWEARHGLTASKYQQTFDALAKRGYRLTDVSATVFAGRDLYAAMWEKKDGPEWLARHRMTADAYQAEFDLRLKQGYRLVKVCGYGIPGQDYYAAIWEKRGGPEWQARHGMTAAVYQQEFDQLVRQGYRLVHVSGYGIGRKDLYAAIWEKCDGPEWVARHRMTSAVYQAEFTHFANQGYRAVQVCGYSVNGQDLYAAIWEKTTSPAWVGRHRMTSASYQQEFDLRAKMGWRLTNVSTYTKG